MAGQFYGESEAQLRAVFERARRLGGPPPLGNNKGTLLFIDEIDSLCPSRAKARVAAHDHATHAHAL